MVINCVWEHNGNDTLLYAVDFIGAYTRGRDLGEAISKMPAEIRSYSRWCGESITGDLEIKVVGEKESTLEISDADSDVMFKEEANTLTIEEYLNLKALALKSAMDFKTLYESIPDKNAAAKRERKTFYGKIPRSANETYEHTKSVNKYYFAEINVNADNIGDIYECRKRAFVALEAQPDFLEGGVITGSYGEEWSLRKVLRRFVWHDRIHAKAMYRMASRLFGRENIANPFYLEMEENNENHK